MTSGSLAFWEAHVLVCMVESMGSGADRGLLPVPRGVAVCRESTSKASHDGNLNRPHTEAFLPLTSQ